MNLNGNNEHDYVLESMKKHGIPATLENYLGLAYPEGLPENFGYEHHMGLPEEIRKDIDKNNN